MPRKVTRQYVAQHGFMLIPNSLLNAMSRAAIPSGSPTNPRSLSRSEVLESMFHYGLIVSKNPYTGITRHPSPMRYANPNMTAEDIVNAWLTLVALDP